MPSKLPDSLRSLVGELVHKEIKSQRMVAFTLKKIGISAVQCAAGMGDGMIMNRMMEDDDDLLLCYFHSQTFSITFPEASTSVSKTPTIP
jgi:hypothetical protein